jgi:hypothetical protein
MVCSPAFARLSETPEQLAHRFGPAAPLVRNATTYFQGHTYPIGSILSFSAEDWSIECTIVDGVCAQITYRKTGDFTDEQLTTILTNESEGSKWSEQTTFTTVVDSYFVPQAHVREWKREDGAHATKISGSITLTNSKYDKAVEAAKAKGTSDAAKMPGNL